MTQEIPRKLLLVEDEVLIAMATSRKLESFGYNVLTANSGEKAIELVHEHTEIALILMDIDLGKGMDGPETAKKILSERNIPIVFLTSHTEYEMVEKVRNITRYGYLLKSFGEFVLRSSIEMAFELFNANENIKSKMQSLQESENRLACAEKIAKNGNWKIYLGTRRIVSSAGAAVIYGVSSTELSLEYIQSVPLPEYRATLDKALKELLTNNIPYEVEFKIRRPADGKIIDIHSIAEYDRNKNVVFGVIQDITETNKLTETLRESETSKTIMLQSIGDAVIATDTAGLVTMMNPTAEALTGWTFNESKGNSLVSIFKIINADTRKVVENPVQKVLDTGRIIGLANHTVLVNKAGVEYQISDSASPIKNKDGEIQGVILVFSDATAKYHLEIERKEKEIEVQRLIEEKELILKEAHHHLKNDMNTISSLLYLQADSLDNEAATAALNDAAGRIESMKIVHEKLYKSSVLQKLSIKDYLESLIEEVISHHSIGKDISVIQNIHDGMIDTQKIKYIGIIINELLTNSMKYAFVGKETGSINIGFTIIEELATLDVSVNGIGINEDIDFGNSKGFGLQLVQALTEQLGGRIRIEHGRGTRIVLEFAP
ncbi:hypothetical protein MASR2M78_22090 [Treponema sp.]